MPVATTLACPAAPRGRLKLGLLQSREPFMDPHDIAGSRERALNAYRSLIRRSLDEHGSLDWLAGGAFALSGPGPFPPSLLEQLALGERCPEIQSLASVAQAHGLRLTLGAWWRDTGLGVLPRLLVFDSDGRWRALRPSPQWPPENVRLSMPASPISPASLQCLAATCRQQLRYGAWIETVRGPAHPPGAPLTMVNGSTIIGPDGRFIARASATAENCVVAEIS